MFIDRLLNEGSTPVVEQAIKFAAAREKLIAQNIANASTPNYVQQDLSVEKFQQMLRDKLDTQQTAAPGSTHFNDAMGELNNPAKNILFHDKNNRSMEQLMSDSAKNALYHNMMIEILKKQIGTYEMALRERVG